MRPGRDWNADLPVGINPLPLFPLISSAARCRRLPWLLATATLGRNGRAFFTQHYSWPVIERKYLDMFDELRHTPAAHGMEPLPGWLARRARTVPAAAGIVNALPKGPANEPHASGSR